MSRDTTDGKKCVTRYTFLLGLAAVTERALEKVGGMGPRIVSTLPRVKVPEKFLSYLFNHKRVGTLNRGDSLPSSLLCTDEL
jgi:hypothetical protein